MIPAHEVRLDGIEQGHEALKLVIAEIQSYEVTIRTEADTRLKIVNRILNEVLGWRLADIQTEERVPGGYVDYTLCTGGTPLCVVEAKRSSVTFELEKEYSGRHFKLSGPVLANAQCKETIGQAIDYCPKKSVGLACATNGYEWIIFTGNRRDGVDVWAGRAYVFSSLEGIFENFALFWKLLSPSAVQSRQSATLLAIAEGRVRGPHPYFESPIDLSSIKYVTPSDLGKDLMRLCAGFLEDLTDPNNVQMLAECFVESKESKNVDANLSKIAEQIIRDIEKISDKTSDGLENALRTSMDTKSREIVLIVGTKGTGKSTYVRRFFEIVLPADLKKKCLVIFIDFKDSGIDEARVSDWLDDRIVEEIEQHIFENGSPTFEDLKGTFRNVYDRLRRGEWKSYYDANRETFDQKFGDYVLNVRNNEKHKYVLALLHNTINARSFMPCLVLDNIDHFGLEFQERVIAYAQGIHGQVRSFVVLPITDVTLWRRDKQGALQSSFTQAFYLPAPRPKDVLKKRVDYMKAVASTKSDKGEYLLGDQMIRLKVESLPEFAAAVQNIFIDTDKVARLIGHMANYDIRRCLVLTQRVICSPYLRIEDLFKAYALNEALYVDDDRIKTSLIRQFHNYFHEKQNEFVVNLFETDRVVPTSPLVSMRVLAYLKVATEQSETPSKWYIDISAIYNYFELLNILPDCLSDYLQKLLTFGLISDYDPTVFEISKCTRLCITPAGIQHVEWAVSDNNYLSNMAFVTRVTSMDVVTKIRNHLVEREELVRDVIVKDFLTYLSNEDRKYVNVPNSVSFERQSQILIDYSKIAIG